MRKLFWAATIVTVALSLTAAGCGFDCEARCKDNIHRIWEPGRPVVPSATICTADAVQKADSCEKCDKALAAQTGVPVDRSTCDD